MIGTAGAYNEKILIFSESAMNILGKPNGVLRDIDTLVKKRIELS